LLRNLDHGEKLCNKTRMVVLEKYSSIELLVRIGGFKRRLC